MIYLRLLLEATSTTRLTLRIFHGCVYTGSFVLDYHAALRVQGIEIPHRTFPEQVAPRILSLESVNYFKSK